MRRFFSSLFRAVFRMIHSILSLAVSVSVLICAGYIVVRFGLPLFQSYFGTDRPLPDLGIEDRLPFPSESETEKPESPQVPENPGTFPVPKGALSLEQRYCWGLLKDREEKKVYKAILRAMQEKDSSVTVKTKLSNDRMLELAGYVQNDFPEFFWLTSGFTVSGMDMPGIASSVKLTFNFHIQKKDIDRAQQQINQAAGEILSQIDPHSSDYDKIKAVFDWLVRHIDYNLRENDQSMYSAMVKGEGVCAGYARSTQYLLNRLGIPCTTVTGYANGGNHGWNLVYAEGDYYYLDTTWGDPIFTGAHAPQNNISYKYFCVTDEVLFQTHQPSDQFPLPRCTATACNYYVRNGLLLEQYDYDQILQIALKAVQKRENIELRFTSAAALSKAEKKLISQKKIFDLCADVNKRLGKKVLSDHNFHYSTDRQNLMLTFLPDYS